jgi:hypothetical protein
MTKNTNKGLGKTLRFLFGKLQHATYIPSTVITL